MQAREACQAVLSSPTPAYAKASAGKYMERLRISVSDV